MRLKILIGMVVLIVLLGIFLLINQPPNAVYGGGGKIATPQPPTETLDTVDNISNEIIPTGEVFGEGGIIESTPSPTITPTETLLPIEYFDAGLGGTFEPGDNVSYLGIQGEITSGKIENGNVLGSPLIIKNEQDGTVLQYEISEHSDYGHLELISYPQDGKVYLKIDGVDSGYVFKWFIRGNFEHYLSLYEYPDYVDVQKFILEKP